MAVDQSDMDGAVEVTIPVEVIRYKFNGETRHGYIFKNTLKVAFQSGESCVIPAPPAFTALPDFQASSFFPDGVVGEFLPGPGPLIWRFEVSPRDRDDFDNTISLTDISNP